MLVRFIKFSSVGTAVSLSSMSLSFFFLKIVGTPLYITYVTLYLTSLSVSYWLNSKYTFKVAMTLRKSLSYFAVYIGGMCIGLVMLNLYKSFLLLENWILVFLVLPFTMSWNFSMASLVTKDKDNKEEGAKR